MFWKRLFFLLFYTRNASTREIKMFDAKYLARILQKYFGRTVFENRPCLVVYT